ncbi:MAG: apolipoprotein N-acyltransferase [Alphaproteobacteria bacterium]|nr:apolipoprotein N-acyltransferase [Alphaproteobacteria bacterium]
MMNFLRRWPGLGLFGLGALSAAGLPPVGAWWVLFITVPLALTLLGEAQARPFWRGAVLGWCLGFGYFLAALHWIGFAFLVDAARDLWMMPIALGGLAAFLALFWAVAALAAVQMAKRGLALWLAAPASFSVLEWLRGHLFTGFPWAVFGQVVDGMGGVAQAAALVGMTGLTLFLWLWPASLLGLRSAAKAERAAAAALLLTLPALYAWGEWRLAQNPTAYQPGIMLRLVQPNISQNDKWREGNARTIYDQLLSLTAAPPSTGQPVTHIIWPESSVPFLIDESEKGRAELARVLQPGQTLLAGAVRRSAPTDDAQYFTSILIINGKAEVLGHYDKWHLVPGGEFLPLAWALEPLGLRKVVSLPESFTAGPGPSTLPVPGAGNAGMSICYEAIFPGAVADPAKRPDWLVNVTNDGWFGKSAGPYQHLAQLRLRAIELGLPAARAANTGISAVIDSFGRVTFASEIGTTGAFDLALPQSTLPPLYSKESDYIPLIVLVLVIGLGVSLKRM